MKTEQWLAAFAVFVACGKSAESKQEPKADPKPADPKPTDPKPTPTGGALAGFYRVESVTMDGKDIVLAEAYRKSLKGDEELDLIRMTFELEGNRLTVGIDQVMGGPGSATYCSVHGTTEVDLAGDKLTVPLIEAVASSGVVTSNGGKTTTDTAKCNVSLKKGTYEIKGTDLSMTVDGKVITMHLVPDEKTIDLKARATAFAKRK